MLNNLEIVQNSVRLGSYALLKLERIAENIANADTPNYRRKTVAPFDSVWDGQSDRLKTRTTRSTHIPFSANQDRSLADTQMFHPSTSVEPNGNTVTLEREIAASAQAKQSHELALTVYDKTRAILRSAIGKQ
ncbi:MAG: hypothetical protein AAF748_02325 [Pseudomonadota bacterium]